MNKVFITLSFLMGVVVLISNYLVQFPVNYFGLNEVLTYGAFSYPMAFFITDISNKFYGKEVARKIVYVGFAIGISFSQLKASLMAATHSLIPALFEKGASKKIIELYEYLEFKKRMDQ